MGKHSAISWTHHTFNPWWGCMAVSPACDNCYAEAWDKRVGGSHWGAKAEYRTFGDKHWNEPLKWNRHAEAAGERHRVFCASMADVFDNRAPEGARERLWALIRETPHLDWLLLTKRPQNIAKMLPEDWGDGYPNIWPGVTVENQAEADRRIQTLLAISARLRFLSCEPLLGPVDLLRVAWSSVAGHRVDVLRGGFWNEGFGFVNHSDMPGTISWVIVGGESGHGARPMHPAWVRSLRDQCVAAGVAFHFKQHGEWADGDSIDPSGDAPYHWSGPRYGEPRWSSAAVGIDGQYGPDAEIQAQPSERMWKCGTKAAGRLLDGREWNEVPA